MALPEDSDDDVWFGPEFRLNESHELEYIGDKYPRDDVPVEDPVVVDDGHGGDDPVTQQEILPDSSENQDVNKKQNTKAKRNTFSYAKKMLLASSELFLDPMYQDKIADTPLAIAELVGQVKECPREANGKRYRIEWKNDGEPLPTGLERSWLCTYLVANKDNQGKLQRAMIAYNSSDRGSKKPRAIGSKKKPPPSNDNQPIQDITKGTPPVAFVNTTGSEARAATASIRTSSTISSLSQNTISSPEARIPQNRSRQGTRSFLSIDSSSDDGDNLDEEDNIYAESLSLDDGSDKYISDDDAVSRSNSRVGVGSLLQDITWNYSSVSTAMVEDKEAPSPYIGPSGLKPRVAESFSNPFECLAVCGGLDYDLVCRLASNSNEYARKHLLPSDRNNRLHGHTFTNITTEEMYHFLGITLRISLSPIDWGGYEAYFSVSNRKVLDVDIAGSAGFAQHYMTLRRYKQIRSAFHPEDRSAGSAGDKCYQLRHAINTLNQAASNTKFIGEDVTFDEGGIGSRHRLNPVRQYNKDKPQKFRVDFFIMACSKTYFIHHLDVYQGANATNVGINRACRDLPTTQKAVLNAVLSTGMHNEVNGARHISLDNRYQCPELAYLLRQKFKIYSTGTCRVNRKGWPKNDMNLDKKDGRGSIKFSVDKDNKVLCCQWVDSRVVNVVSSILSSQVTEIKRQVGSEKKSFTCPTVVTRYQRNMIGVDKSDQMRAAGGGFALKAHYKKWYKRAYFAILDMMTLNALIAWNLSAQTSSGRRKRTELKRHEFLWYIAQCMLDYREKTSETVTVTTTNTSATDELDGHAPLPCSDSHARCAVCRVDYNTERLALKVKAQSMDTVTAEKQSQRFITNTLAQCSRCRITAHPTIPKQKRLIHSLEGFVGLTCFQIVHSKVGYEIWRRCDPSGISTSGRVYNPQMKHALCQQLRKLHGLDDPEKARKRKKSNIDDNSDLTLL
jgi:Transposase IS4